MGPKIPGAAPGKPMCDSVRHQHFITPMYEFNINSCWIYTWTKLTNPTQFETFEKRAQKRVFQYSFKK